MNIKITARKFKAHDTLKEYIKDSLSSLERYNDSIIDTDVILSFQNQKDSIKIAEILLKVPGTILKAQAESDEFQKSVNMATEKLIRQLRKLKTKTIKHI